ncbi:hypothetical protein Q9L58_010669, partial [Maublancomyces gigas]
LKTAEVDAQRSRNQVVLDLMIQKMLLGLCGPVATGVQLQYADGQLCLCFPVLYGWVADHLEHVTLQHLKNNCCPVCQVDTSSLGDIWSGQSKFHNHDQYQAKLAHFREAGDVADLDWLQVRGLKALMNSFWQLPKVRPEEMWKPDLLHTIYLGLLKHLMEWVQGFLGKYYCLEQFDVVWKSIPPYSGVTIPKIVYRAVSQWQGKEMRNLGRFLLGALMIALRKPSALEGWAFKHALTCVQALLDFHLMAQYQSHTAEILTYMESYLQSFHNHKDIFLEFRKSKKAKAKATAADKFLRQVQTNAASTAVKPLQASKNRKVAAEDKLEKSDQLRNIYRKESHFNFIKIHLSAHFTGHVKPFENIPRYSTEVGEVSRRKQIKVGYRASNRIHYTKQILEHYAYRQTVTLHAMAIRMVAHGKLPGDLGEQVTDLLNKESLPAWMQ